MDLMRTSRHSVTIKVMACVSLSAVKTKYEGDTRHDKPSSMLVITMHKRRQQTCVRVQYKQKMKESFVKGRVGKKF